MTVTSVTTVQDEDNEPLVTRLKSVMKKQKSDFEEAQMSVTYMVDNDRGAITRMTVLSYADFVNFGRPEELTVTIEPGDLLNE